MKITYKNKIVSFIDVLGFKNIIYAKDTNPINKYFDFIFNCFEQSTKSKNFTYHLISDSIVIECHLTKENLLELTKVLCILQYRLLSEGILVRGSISQGELYVNKSKNIIVGTGLINAYNLEQQAIFPRIIFDKKLIPMFFTGTVNAIEELKWVVFNPPSKYISDYIYLNYTRSFSLTNKNSNLKTVLQIFDENYYSNLNINKYEWLKIHIVNSVEEQLDFLNSRIDKTPNERARIRQLNKFLISFKNI